MIIEESFLKPMHRHFINLTCLVSGDYAKTKNNGMPAFYNISAFIVEVDNRWFAITAGHIFEKLKEAQNEGVKISNWKIDDSIVSHNSAHPYPIPLDIDRDVLYLSDDVPGMDYACFEIGNLARQALSEQGIQAISSGIWSADDMPKYSKWILIGTPESGVVFDFNKPTRKLHVTIMLKPVPVNEIPADLIKEYGRCYASLDRSSIGSTDNQFDIEGMSGGPIFGLKPTTQPNSSHYEYRIIGIQSGWYKSSDHIAFCAAQPFIETLEQCIKKVPNSLG